MCHHTVSDSVQVIGRAAAVLRAVAGNLAGLTLADIARQAGLARSTIQRIVRSLEAEGFLQLGPRRRYLIGSGLKALVSGPEPDVAAIAQPFLRQLALEVDETVDLSVLSGATALFIGHVPGTHRLAALSAVGSQFPLHSTANGKALLATLPPERQASLLADGLPADTLHTITDFGVLREQLREVARSGIAYDLEEHTEGVCALGTAFIAPGGGAYAISIPAPRQRFEGKARALEKPLLICRDQIVGAVSGSLPC